MLGRINLTGGYDFTRARRTNSMDVPQGVLDTLASRNVHTHHSRHGKFLQSTLALLMTGICAAYAHNTPAPHYLAAFTNTTH
jgi:hypothetical protein